MQVWNKMILIWEDWENIYDIKDFGTFWFICYFIQNSPLYSFNMQ